MARHAPTPDVRVTMYNVGFGDCFLLTFDYHKDGKRKILIDCGSTSERKGQMAKVVERILKDCDGHVDAVVATHRHSDHIGAFGLAGLGTKLASLAPEVVIQPWTEHPDAAENAVSAPASSSALSAAGRRQCLALKMAQEFAARVVSDPDRVLAGMSQRERRRLEKIAALSIPNKKAILCLAGMGKRRVYVNANGPSGLDDLLPGVRVSVLGPPTVEQHASVASQTKWDSDEFWKLHAGLAGVNSGTGANVAGKSMLLPKTGTRSIAHAPSYVKWLVDKVDTANAHNVKRIVRALDDALNNTSVILLFEVGQKALLFSGDAQLENWQYALANKDIRKRLRATRLYKVGHHGSTNATPKSLYKLFRRGRTSGFLSLLSTKEGHHQGVPRKSLLDALKQKTDLQSTQSWNREISKTFEVCRQPN